MCGIFGQFTAEKADPDLIHRMAHCIAHRGPDGYDIHVDDHLAFGAGRLAIIDLSAPAGPLFSEDQRVSVVYNGEIYNHVELREELLQKGHIFRTHTDSEVLVHGYEEWGLGLLDHLAGMFALCLYDADEKRLLVARDRIGEKPLYYIRRENGEFLFASEIKALLLHPEIHAAVNHEALPYYLTLGYVPPSMTMFAGIQKLAPGSYLQVTLDDCIEGRYWRANSHETHSLSYEEARQQVRERVFSAVESRMMSDVPVGALLSGGVDSAAVVALMQSISDQPVNTFTVGFDYADDPYADEKFNVDLRYAKQAAKHIGTRHHAITIQHDFVAELLPHLVYHMDEPIAQHSIIQTAYVTALARSKKIPVLLSGDAGDELFLGYEHYRSDQRIASLMHLPRLIRHRLLKPLFEQMPARFHSLIPKFTADDPATRYLEWMRFMRTEDAQELIADAHFAQQAEKQLSNLLSPLLQAGGSRPFVDRIAYASLNLWIPEDSNMRVDKMSMMMSVETRAPLEDHHLVDFALGLPMAYKLRNGDLKHIFKDAMRDLLPAAILERKKWGFIPPTSDWLRTNLRPLVDHYLAPEYVRAAGMCQPEVVTRLVEEHMTHRGYHLKPLWALLILHLWHAIFIDKTLSIGTAITPEELVSGSQIETTG